MLVPKPLHNMLSNNKAISLLLLNMDFVLNKFHKNIEINLVYLIMIWLLLVLPKKLLKCSKNNPKLNKQNKLSNRIKEIKNKKIKTITKSKVNKIRINRIE